MEIETIIEENSKEDLMESPNTSKELEVENVDAIKKFIEEQDKEITQARDNKTTDDNTTDDKTTDDKTTDDKTTNDKTTDDKTTTETEPNTSELIFPEELIEPGTEKVESTKESLLEDKSPDETLAVASSVMDMILRDSEAKIAQNLDEKTVAKSPGKLRSIGGANNTMALSVGSKVEAKDFEEIWYPAQIIEVDFDEMEVLVHYEDLKKHDEWITVSSPRLRPIGSKPKPPTPPQNMQPLPSTSAIPATATIKEEIKVEKIDEKPKKLTFAAGERCLARWRDNRRFIATVSQDLGDSQYEILFDDGVKWTCNVSRLAKLKQPKNLTIDTTCMPNASSTPSPVYDTGPSNESPQIIVPITPVATPSTHLFDPTRDYLGSKSERREMKRKLNIKEIFNIGQKKKKVEEKVVQPKKMKKTVERKPKVVLKKIKVEKDVDKKASVHVKETALPEVKIETQTFAKDIPDAVASIIGTVTKEETPEIQVKEEEINVDVVDPDNCKMDLDDAFELANSETLSAPESQEMKREDDSPQQEVKLEKFDTNDDKHEEVLDRMKVVITKLEDGINQVETKVDKLEVKSEGEIPCSEQQENPEVKEKKKSKVKRVKKVRMLQEKRVKKQVERVKNELENMKKQMEEMRRQMSEELAKKQTQEMPESFLLPGEWCCKWVNGQPVGMVSEIEYFGKPDPNNKPALPRRSVQVEDKRLPPGWTKHMVRRSLGNSAGKWDVVLMSPDNRRFHTKTDMRLYLEQNPDADSLKPFESALMDFGIHMKLSRRMGWFTTTPDGEQTAPLPVGTLCTTSPLVKRKPLSLNKFKEGRKKDRKKIRVKLKSHGSYPPRGDAAVAGSSREGLLEDHSFLPKNFPEEPELPPLEDGCVYVGSLKVEIIADLLRCPAEGCYKNFRNNTLLKMHIKHYHRELRKCLGATPKVIDLAHARTKPTEMEMRRLKLEAQTRTIKVKLPRLPKKVAEVKPLVKDPEPKMELQLPVKKEVEKIPRSLDSPKLRNALSHKAKSQVKRPKVLLPVRRQEDIEIKEEDVKVEPKIEVPEMEALDFETAISTHTVTKPPEPKKKKLKLASEDEEWPMMNSDVETRSSYPRSGTPDSKADQKLVSSESNEEQKEANYMFTETGERIKIVHMKREEIINCHCGFREEDGLMVQCELCLCWQHALCHNIHKEADVPEKYTCSICLNPRRGRRSARFLHDQDRLYEGLLPGARPSDELRRSHELAGNLLRLRDCLHAMRLKCYIANKKNHPKLYLWAKDWETTELALTQEKLNSDYSDLSIMINSLGKENLPVKSERDLGLDIRTPPSEEQDSDRYSQKDSQLGSQALLSGLLSSPGGASLDLPISTTELERLAKTVQAEAEAAALCPSAPVPEAPIENSACREHLLRHIQRAHAVIDARLDSIEAQVAELESQDPSFEDDETADYFPRTKQTITMLMRDLDTMEELGNVT